MGRMKWLGRIALPVLALGALAVACGDDAAEPRVVTTVAVTPSSTTLNAVGATAQLTVVVLDQYGETMTGVTVTWSSSNESVATVDSDGEVTAEGNGTATISAVADGESDGADVTVAQVAASVDVTPAAGTLAYVGETLQLMATAEDANSNNIVNPAVTWSTSDASIADVDAASGEVTAVSFGLATITATVDSESGDAAVTVDIRQRPVGDIVLYRDLDPWWGSGADTATLNTAPFNFVVGTDYFINPTSDLSGGIPANASLIVFPSPVGDATQVANQVAAKADLEAWVRAGGWLLVHGADNLTGPAYDVPGLTGLFDDLTNCTGQTLMVADNAFIRGPDATLGTADDLTDVNIDTQPAGGCSDNHGSLEGILPGNAEVYITEEGGTNRPIYATYALDAGRVIVTTITLEFQRELATFIPTMRNSFYWAIYGLDAPAAPAPGPVAPATFDRPAGEMLDSKSPPVRQ